MRGKKVAVCRNRTVCVTVTIIDCNCGPNANLIDLYADAFVAIAPRYPKEDSRYDRLKWGALKVKVHP